MHWSLAVYRRALVEAITHLEKQGRQAADELREYPVAYRRARSAKELPDTERRAFTRYQRAKKQASVSTERLDLLRDELVDLDLGRVTPELCDRELLTWLNAVRSPEDLPAFRSADPRVYARKGLQPLDPKVVEAIVRARRRQRGGEFPDLDAALRVPGVTEELLTDLARTVCRLGAEPEPPEPPAASPPGIGVMLPARLETRFYPPSGDEPEWRLRLRVIPDEPFIDRHDPRVSEFEAQSVDRLLASLPEGRLWFDRGQLDGRCQVLWQQFADLHGGPRAAWLVRQRSAGEGKARRLPGPGRGPEARGEIYYSRLRGLPAVLEVWMARAGTAPVSIATLMVSQDPADLVLDIPIGDGAGSDPERWWSSWEKAKAAGLATEIRLGSSEPADIDALYVVGLGEADPAPLFEAHWNSGLLGVMSRGTPTNTVDGELAADLADDTETWRRVAVAGEAGPLSRDLSRFLTGNSDAVGRLPGSTEDARTLGRAMVAALWMPLWGHALKDIWKQGAQVHEAGLWAMQNLLAEGPLPPIRLGNVPYGLLPVTSLALWKPQKSKGGGPRRSLGDPSFEERLRESLLALRQLWAGIAEKDGTVAGADTDQLLALLGRTASSGSYAYRHSPSTEVVRLVLKALGAELSEADLETAWQEANSLVAPFLREPGTEHRLVSLGGPSPLDMELVQPAGSPLEKLVADLRAIARLHDMDNLKEGLYGKSLLTRLAIRARNMSAAEVVLQSDPAHTPEEPVMEPASASLGTAPQLETLAHLFERNMLVGNTSPQALLYAGVQDGLEVLADALENGVPVSSLERVLRATLDTAIYRLDPWITGYAWRRLRDLVPRSARTKRKVAQFRHKVGLYAWVDGPAPGVPGPTQGGLLHAPSDAQAMTAAILRDKVLHDPPESRDRWQMDLDSSEVRSAERIALQVREGMHLWEVLGLEIERIVGDDESIRFLRSHYPMRDLLSERRTCNGEAVLEIVRTAEDVGETLKIPLAPAQVAGLRELVAALDAYADLLVAQAVHFVVTGRADIAGAAMDAAAGLASPPTLEVLHTPRQGRSIATSVLTALPAPDPAAPGASPGRIAEPALAAFLESRAFRRSETWTWRYSWGRSREHSAQVSLAELVLDPVDTLNLPASKLEEMARDCLPRPDAPGLEVEQAGVPALHARARDLVTVLGSQPALPEDWQTGAELGREPIRADLSNRYLQLRVAAEQAIAALHSASGSQARQEALHNALRWGVTPLEQGLAPEDDPDERLVTLAQRAAESLEGRLESAPSLEEASTLSLAQLATAIAELASPEGRLPVLSHVPLASISDGLTAGRASRDGGRLDADWLSTVAAVRPRLAHLEVYQMAAQLGGEEPPLQAWTNRPRDIWQADEPPASDDTGVIPGTRLVVVYGPKGVISPANGKVALGLVDRWSETIPDWHHSTTAAVGFEAPAARAPQAILLAVPPRLDEPLDAKTLVTILEETRELARARMATYAGLEGMRTALPLASFPVLGQADVLPEEED